MIVGTGVDIVEVRRLREAIQRHGERFTRRVFTPAETEYCRRAPHPEQRFATRFAAKEAALKALGTGWSQGLSFREVQVTNDELGKPSVTFAGRALQRSRELGVGRIHVSMTHHREYAIAQVILEDGS